MASTIVHRTDTWPIVVSTIFGKEHSEETLRDAYAQWTGFMQRGPHVLIMDMTRGTAGATAAQRARVAAWLEENEPLFKAGKQLAHVMVIDNPVIRGVVTAVFWLRPPANPHYTARTLSEAVDIAVRCLREANLRVSPEAIASARSGQGVAQAAGIR
jgi:hypothetical protein